jgi:hypothetical protein
VSLQHLFSGVKMERSWSGSESLTSIALLEAPLTSSQVVYVSADYPTKKAISNFQTVAEARLLTAGISRIVTPKDWIAHPGSSRR